MHAKSEIKSKLINYPSNTFSSKLKPISYHLSSKQQKCQVYNLRLVYIAVIVLTLYLILWNCSIKM